MKNINKNNWYIQGNQAKISLMRLHASFNVCKNDESVFYQLIVNDNDMKTLTLNFYTLEDVISFVENVVSKCNSLDEVLTNYQQMFYDGLFSLPNEDKSIKSETLDLTKEEVDQAIIDYFGKDKDYGLSVERDLYIDYNGVPKVAFYLVDYKDDSGRMLTEGDVKNVLSSYADSLDYELIDYKYVGGIHRAGYSYDEDTPHYEGIEVRVKPKEIKKTLKR